MPFDVDKLFFDCCAKIQRFAMQHSDETFYAIAIDANMLCLNSIEQFARKLEHYQSSWRRRTRVIECLADMTEEDYDYDRLVLEIAERFRELDRNDDAAVLHKINDVRERRRSQGCPYDTEEGVNKLRNSTRDWAYWCFAHIDDGFDVGLYMDHLYTAADNDDSHALDTDFPVTMTELIGRLRASDAFAGLRRSDDFVVTWVDTLTDTHNHGG